MFEYFYHEILRRTVISFGSLFNNISIKHTNSSDSVVNNFKVPLAYGPTQKFLARLNQSPDLSRATQMTLPRMSFEFTGLTYDPSESQQQLRHSYQSKQTTQKSSKKFICLFHTICNLS